MKQPRTKIISDYPEDFLKAALHLDQGGLLAFPTETVYGLGASINSEPALALVFKVKNRPLSDPLIVHVSSFSSAISLWDLSEESKRIIDRLMENFWPGPLTIVAKKAASVSHFVCASGDYVGVRMPSHHVAQKLLKAVSYPLAAPSANYFGHVSPTCAQHVLDDFPYEPEMWVMAEGGDLKKSCSYGIESTVVKVADNGVVMLRPGMISKENIDQVLFSAKGLEIRQNVYKYQVTQNLNKDAHALDSPGQLLSHYSPRQEALLLCQQQSEQNPRSVIQTPLQYVACVDFGKKYLSRKNDFGFYFDLSPDSSVSQAAWSVFACLRSIEAHQEIELILLPNLEEFQLNGQNKEGLMDRLFRAASGKLCVLDTLIKSDFSKI